MAEGAARELDVRRSRRCSHDSESHGRRLNVEPADARRASGMPSAMVQISRQSTLHIPPQKIMMECLEMGDHFSCADIPSDH